MKRRRQDGDVHQVVEEGECGRHDERDGERRRFQRLNVANRARPGRPDEDEWRDQQDTHHVADPPRAPCVANVRRTQQAAGVEGRDAPRGADQRAHHRRPDDQRRRRADPLERDAEPRHSLQERGTDECLARVAGSDADRDQHASAGEQFADEGAEEDAQRGMIAEQQHGGECDPRRWPDERREAEDRIERQAESGRDEVDRGQPQHDRDLAQTRVHDPNGARPYDAGAMRPRAPVAFRGQADPADEHQGLMGSPPRSWETACAIDACASGASLMRVVDDYPCRAEKRDR